MTTARAILGAAALVTLGILAAAGWVVSSQPKPERYQLVNVGKGETQRLDKLTGTVMRCVYGRCEVLTDGAATIDKRDDWDAFPTAPDPE